MTKYKIYVTKEMKIALEQDAKNFEVTKKDGSYNMNAFLKMLILNYYPNYNSKNYSIYNKMLKEIQKSVKISYDDADVLTDKLIALCKGDHSNNYYLRGTPSESITLSTSGDIDSLIECIIHDHSGEHLSYYLREMFSSYLTLSRNIREKIIYKPLYESLEEYIDKKQVITFTTKRKNNKSEIKYRKICPYAIKPSKDAGYNYLLGFDIIDKKTYSFRLSRIVGKPSIPENHRKYKLEDSIIKKLEKSATIAPQFSFDDAVEVVVRFTEEGKRKYEMIFTNRPILSNIVDGNYHFEWPEEQFFEYIIRFGKEAHVLKPQSLIDKIKQYYMEACDIYQTPPS